MIDFQIQVKNQKSITITVRGSEHEVYHIFYHYPPLMFINIMKNGSTSLRKVCQELCRHIKTRDNFYFTVVRDPMDRFVSTMHFLNHYPVDLLGKSLIEYPSDASYKFLDDMMHFLPQSSVVANLDSNIDLKYYHIRNLEPLRKRLQTLSGKTVTIPKVNQTKRFKKRSSEIADWINLNKKFVNDFLERDFEWIASLDLSS